MNRPLLTLSFGVLACGAGLGAGCNIVGGLIGGMAASHERSGSHEVAAKYPGLEAKTFCVVVAADRSIQGEHPDLVPLVTREVTRRLIENCGASGVVPADDILNYQYRRPGWVAMSPAELASELEVERLVFIDVQSYSLTEPGNPYLWNGTASATLSVLETDSRTPSDFAYQTNIRVQFPDNEGLSEVQVPRQTVALELARRFVTRISWTFYEHTEPNVIKY